MPCCDLGLDEGSPGKFRGWWCTLEKSKGRGKTIHLGQKLDMIRPGCGTAFTHFHDILNHVEYCKAGIAPDIVEEAEGSDVLDALNRQFTKQKVKGWCWRRLAQL